MERRAARLERWIITFALTALLIPSTGQAEPVRITFLNKAVPREYEPMRQIAERFNASQDRIEWVIITPGANDIIEEAQLIWHAAGAIADILYLTDNIIGGYVEAGMLLPLDAYLAKEPSALAAVPPGITSGLSYLGSIWGVPNNFGANVIHYNRAMMNERGVGSPDTDWTWEDLLDVARKLTVRADNPDEEVYGFFTNNHFRRATPFIWQAGGGLLSSDMSSSRFSSPESLEGLEFIYSLYHEHQVAPTFSRIGSSSAFASLFVNGRLGMFQDIWQVQSWTAGAEESPPFDWDIAPLPQYKTKATSGIVRGYGISSLSQRPDEAWEVIKFLVSPEAQEITASFGWPPVAVAHEIPRRVWMEAYPEATSPEVYFDATSHIRWEFGHPEGARMAQVWARAMGEIINDGLLPGIVAEQVDREINAIIRAWLERQR